MNGHEKSLLGPYEVTSAFADHKVGDVLVVVLAEIDDYGYMVRYVAPNGLLVFSFWGVDPNGGFSSMRKVVSNE